MNRAIFFVIVLSLVMVSAHFALAEVSVISTGTPSENVTPLFSIENTPTGISIITPTMVGTTYVFVNGKLAQKYESLAANDEEDISLDRTIENEVEIRYLKTYHYEWEDYKITRDETPLRLEYLKYEKDDKVIKFSLGGADIIHPDDIDSTKNSVEKSFSDYKVRVNGETNLNCYPRITTGTSLYFKCKSSVYPHQVTITTTLGVSEKTVIGASVIQNTADSDEEPVTAETPEVIVEEVIVTNDETNQVLLQEEDQGNASAPEETATLDNISMTDTLLETKGMTNAVKFLILGLFLAVMALLFIASHHKHENRQAGVLHPHKHSKK